MRIPCRVLYSIGLCVSTFAASAGATGEVWYSGLYPCDYFQSDDVWESDDWGYASQSLTNEVVVNCGQPHFSGNNGYAAHSTAWVYDSTDVDQVCVALVRSSGGENGNSTAWETLCTTVGGHSTSSSTLDYSVQTDSLRSHYYWQAYLPPRDQTGTFDGDGMSYFSGSKFIDN
jgi:hypothetical protein